MAARGSAGRSMRRCSTSGTAQAPRAAPGQGEEEETHFGYSRVRVGDKVDRVKGVFSSVAESYDVMNDLMSAGVHRLWKDDMVARIGLGAMAAVEPEACPRVLDVAGGTGDVAFRIVEAVEQAFGTAAFDSHPFAVPDAERQVVLCDINASMLEVGRRRAASRLSSATLPAVGFVEGNAEALPFPDGSFDLYTIAFGLRNVTDKPKALREARRVLRRGGRFMCLEFSRVRNPLLRTAYDAYSFNVIPRLGATVAGDSASYQYLVESIRMHPGQEELAGMMRDAGFGSVAFRDYTFGVVALHEGVAE